MFLKSLKIATPTEVIRELTFHKGLNLIVDNTPERETSTGNNVGKTTILKLVDYCLGQEGNVIYTDPENKRTILTEVKDFLFDNKVIITLKLVDNLDCPERVVVIERNFSSKRDEKICTINGDKVNITDMEDALQSAIFPSLTIKKPTFRQIIAHNIRYEDYRLNRTLEIIHHYASNEVYETLYLFMFGCNYDKGQLREELIVNIKSEEKYLNRLQRENTKSAYKVVLEAVNREIFKLEEQKSKLNINPQLEEDLTALTHLKESINSIGSQRNSLEIKKKIIQDSVEGFKDQQFECDLGQLRLIYQQASALVPNLHHTFEEMVDYHNKMLINRIEFISGELPNIEQKIGDLTKQFEELRIHEEELTQKITSSNTFEELENIINKLNDQYTLKGRYENIIYQIEEVEGVLSQYYQQLTGIDNDLFADDFQQVVENQLSKFNVIFGEVSDALYHEHYAVKYDVTTPKKGQKNYKFAIVDTNLSTGKKQGEISCFDIAYTMFADQENIPCLHFLLNDKKELMHDHQLVKLAEIANRENIQFVASILKDKLPVQLKDKSYYVVELSESDKLFRIERV